MLVMEKRISPMVTIVYWGRSHMMWTLLSSTIMSDVMVCSAWSPVMKKL